MFASMPGSALHLIWREAGPVRSEHGFMLLATVGFAECPVLDLLRPSNRQANQK
jgi:cyclohexyl-isocyanide hydratase